MAQTKREKQHLVDCFLFFLFTLLIVFSYSNANSQTKNKNAIQTNSQYAIHPFDISQETLPPAYQGHSCQEITKKLKTITPKRDEFDTDESYAQRSQGLTTSTLYGNIKVGDIISFVKSTPNLVSNYMPEANWMEMTFPFISQYALPGKTPRLVDSEIINSTPLSRSKYLAENAFGKTIYVTKEIYDVCAVVFHNRDSTYKKATARFAIAPIEAREAKDNYALMYIGIITEPYYSYFNESTKPTIDMPFEINRSGPAVVIKLQQLWLFNKITGKVYYKLNQ